MELVDGVPQPRYRAASGTSMAGPHSAAALSLIMQRFPYLTNTQALQTMFTTGRQNNTINDADGTAVPNPTRGQIVQVPDRRNGWHTVSLREAMRGPGQLLGPFHVDTHGYSDVWSNDISDVAIQAREQEDATEAAAWRATKIARGWTRGLPANASEKALTPGTVLTIMSGRSISGRFHGLPDGRVMKADGHWFRVSYKNNSVTLTVIR